MPRRFLQVGLGTPYVLNDEGMRTGAQISDFRIDPRLHALRVLGWRRDIWNHDKPRLS
jgi:hypothetical protein